MLLDRQPQAVATGMGGASTFWKPQLIYVCINCTPKQMSVFLDHPQWKGRIHEVRFLNNEYVDPTKMANPMRLGWDTNTSPNYSDGRPYVGPQLPVRKRSKPMVLPDDKD